MAGLTVSGGVLGGSVGWIVGMGYNVGGGLVWDSAGLAVVGCMVVDGEAVEDEFDGASGPGISGNKYDKVNSPVAMYIHVKPNHHNFYNGTFFLNDFDNLKTVSILF